MYSSNKIKGRERQQFFSNELLHGKHGNKALWIKSMRYCRQQKLKEGMDCLEQLLMNHPHYFPTCISNFTYCAAHFIESLWSPNPSDLTGLSQPSSNLLGTMECSFFRVPGKLSRKDKKLIHSLLKRWIYVIKFGEKMGMLSKPNCRLREAYIFYELFLFSVDAPEPETLKLVFKAIALHPWDLSHIIRSLKIVIGKGWLDGARKILQHVFELKRKHQQFEYSTTTFIFIHYFHCYLLVRYERFAEAAAVWSEVERRCTFEEIEKCLFFHFQRSTKQAQQLSSDEAVLLQAINVRLRNISVLDLKMKYLCGLKRFEDARKVSEFYMQLWGEDSQTVFYQGFLDFQRQNMDSAISAIVTNNHDWVKDPASWVVNQHHFAALVLYDLECYEHAKIHAVGAVVSGDHGLDPIFAEYYLHLAQILNKCAMYKLAKYFLCKSYRITPSIPRIQKDYMQLLQILNAELDQLQCAHCAATMYMNNLKTRSGCGSTYYCSKKCQKLHWKSEHRTQCNRSWKDLWAAWKNPREAPVSCEWHAFRDSRNIISIGPQVAITFDIVDQNGEIVEERVFRSFRSGIKT